MFCEQDMAATITPAVTIDQGSALSAPEDFSSVLVGRMLETRMCAEADGDGANNYVPNVAELVNKDKVLKVVSTFLSKTNEYLMKCAEIGRVSGLAHIVYGKYSRYTMLSGTPALYVGKSIASAFSPKVSPMWAANTIFDIVSSYYDSASIPLRAERYSGSGRWIGFYSLDRSRSSVRGAIEMHIDLLGAHDFKELVDRDVFDSDIDAWLAGVPLSDIFA